MHATSAVRAAPDDVAFVLISKLYRHMCANTGIATDSARVQRSARWARRLAYACAGEQLAEPALN